MRLKILGMFILLWLSAGLFSCICTVSLASLETCFLSWSMIVNWHISALGWLYVYTMLEYSVGRWGIVFFDPTFQESFGFSYIRRIAVYLRGVPLINHILAQPYWILSLRCISRVFMCCTLWRLFRP